MKHNLWLFLALALCACSDTTAAGRVTIAGTQTLSAVQINQYLRDSHATQAADDATALARAYALAATASGATQTQIAVTQRAVAQATAALYTQQAVSTQAMRDATQTAVRDRDATATAQAQVAERLTLTADTSRMRTETAAVVGTQTALDLTTRANDAQRQQVANWAAVVLVIILALLGLWVFVSIADVVARRLAVSHYGPNRNPLVILPGGVVYNPLTGISSNDALPDELRDRLAVMGQEILAIQAQHAPHPPIRPEPSTKREWHIGPVGATTERISVERPPAPALPAGADPRVNQKQVAPPAKDKMHLVFVENANMDPAEKKLFDLRELVEGAEVRGLTRARWEGYKFSTGNECTQGYHAELVDVLKAAQVVAQKGKTYIMRVSTDKAIETLGLQAYDYR